MSSFTGSITFQYDIEYASTPEVAEKIINYVLDTFGQHEFGHLTFSWDNSDWTMEQVEEKVNG